MITFRCKEHCKDNGYSFAGVQYGKYCFCGNKRPAKQFLAGQQSECNKACAGDSGVMCGGYWRMNVYCVDESVCQRHRRRRRGFFKRLVKG